MKPTDVFFPLDDTCDACRASARKAYAAHMESLGHTLPYHLSLAAMAEDPPAIYQGATPKRPTRFPERFTYRPIGCDAHAEVHS
jgi:hypothetical protein